ncbi:hypothetical protein SETIT_2G165100v2 [Setaria italica]|uniref:Uncharacterized protein n=1 Tax=Setaria italica TaxID=4555 RepID=A0A368Q047_SETIT|nr:hypothetical protein SETIT_2G165100v2 [Setaria italica]
MVRAPAVDHLTGALRPGYVMPADHRVPCSVGVTARRLQQLPFTGARRVQAGVIPFTPRWNVRVVGGFILAHEDDIAAIKQEAGHVREHMRQRPLQLGVAAGEQVVQEEVVVLAWLQEEPAVAVVQDLQVLVAAEPCQAVHGPVHGAEWGGDVGAGAGAGVAEVPDAACGVEQAEERRAEVAAAEAEAAEERRGGAEAAPPLAHRRGDGEARLGREADEDLANGVVAEVIE